MTPAIRSPRTSFDLGARRAFSLIELGCVLVVLGALSLTAIPSVRGIDAARRGVDRERVLTAVCAARRLATASGTPHGAWFGAGGDRVELRVWPEGDPAASPAAGALGVDDAGSSLDADGVASVSVGGAGLAVWFDASGAPLDGDPDGGAAPAGAAVEVVFESGRTVRVMAYTGMVTP